MAVTLTASYKQFVSANVAEKIEQLLDDCYDLSAMLEFIDDYSEDDFVNFYDEYVRCGEQIGYEAVDALIKEMGCVSYIEECDERYQGTYENEADFAESYTSELYGDVPSYVVVDWESTWEANLLHEFTSCSDGSSYRSCHIFRDY
jgi:hypothetical protein